MLTEKGKFLNVYEVFIPEEIGPDFEEVVSNIPNARIRKKKTIPFGERVLDWETELRELEGLVQQMQLSRRENPEASSRAYEELRRSLEKNGFHDRVNLPERILSLFTDSLEYFKQLGKSPYMRIAPEKAVSYSVPEGTLSPRAIRVLAYVFGLSGERKDIYELQKMEGMRNASMLITENVRVLAYTL